MGENSVHSNLLVYGINLVGGREKTNFKILYNLNVVELRSRWTGISETACDGLRFLKCKVKSQILMLPSEDSLDIRNVGAMSPRLLLWLNKSQEARK